MIPSIPVHPLKALSPIEVTVEKVITPSMPVHPLKAELPMTETADARVKSVM